MTSASAEDLRKYIEGAEYPAFTEDLIAAEARGAPAEATEGLRSLGAQQQFAGPEAVLTTLRRPRRPGCLAGG